MNSNLREGFLRVMDGYLDAKRGVQKGINWLNWFERT